MSASIGPEGSAGEAGERPRRTRQSVLLIVAIWAGWAIALLSFQEIVLARVGPERPDPVLEWTASETGLQRANGRPYLGVDVFATHIAFDSEYYLSIAAVGYDDPVTQYVGPDGDVALNYAFLPGYPFAMRAVAAPLTWLGVDSAPAAAAAGVGVSLGATLVAMLALFSAGPSPPGRCGRRPHRVLPPHLSDGLLPGAGLQRGLLRRRLLWRAGRDGGAPAARGCRLLGGRRAHSAGGRRPRARRQRSRRCSSFGIGARRLATRTARFRAPSWWAGP